MVYKNLPPVGEIPLPELELLLNGNSSSRLGGKIQKVWLHRWAGGTYRGVIHQFQNPASDSSSHVVYAGEIGIEKGKAAQLVPWDRKAWTQAFYNRTGLSIECADPMWLGKDPRGFARTARIVAFLCLKNNLPANWVHGRTFGAKGFLRHYDGGRLAGGHTDPTLDLELWRQFVGRVKQEHQHGHFRKQWGVR